MINNLINSLKKEYPLAICSLDFDHPLDLLIATILAAQCTDKRVNIVTIDLFKKYKNVYEYANADIKELESLIRTTGFYHNKAKNIIGCCVTIINKFSGVIPQTMDQLITLPGVGRKTANVLLHNAFGLNEGIVVDTHCIRLSKRLGLTTYDDAIKIEKDLMKIVPKDHWSIFGHLFVFHGRAICNARSPKCNECVINILCPKVNVTQK